MKQGIKKGLSTAVSVALVTSMMLGTGKSYTANAAVKDDYKEMLNMPLSKEVKEKILSEITSTKVNPIETNVAAKEVNLDEVIRVMVELDGTSALDKVEKGEKANSKDVKNIEESQKPIITQIEKLGGTVRHQYASVINGLSVEIRRGDVDKLKAIKGVSKVTEATCYAPQMETAKDLTQAEAVWKNYSLKGEGMVVAVIDTGIDYMHEAMRAPADKSKEKLSFDSIKAIKAKGVLKADNNINTYYTEKIPFAYNYADRSSIVKDKEVSAHGMHVAGIIAANGTDEKVNADKSVKGVAPEAQILAMKVFSNNPAVKGCYADDVVAAIEDAVALGADVINMSLGSPAGFVHGENVEQEAIRKAVDAGVTVVVSAGNSGHSIYYSTNPKYNDIATVGSPALAKDALMVASYENVRKKSPVIKFNDEKGNVVGYYEYNLRADKDIRPLLNQGLEIVNCGLGKEGDFKEDLNGKIALIKRGEITFTEKIANAEKKGAVAVILYNRDGDNTAMGMAIEPQIKIPSTSIGNAGGAIIAKALSEGKKIKTGTGEDFVPNVNYLDFASSSSWGPSPSLDFKPQIAAPGASIFSTYNDSLYGMMSGTSMAAPHVSGGMALILEAIKGYAPELKGRELVELAKNIAMNTSEVKMDKFNKGVPVSPRRQGAGLMQIENAIKDRVVATSNGQSSVALKEIKGNKATFKIDLRNIGSTDVKYTLENVGGVLTQNNKKMVGTEPNMVCDEILPKEQANLTFSSNDIVVPAKGKASVEVTLNIASAVSTERFLEGFVRFNANDKETPSIVMPFIGFYGDWSKESILNNWIWDEEKTSFVASIQSKPDYKDFKVESCLTTKNGKEEKKTILGLSDIDKDKISYYAKENVAISPNDDKLNDFVIPELYLMRNIKEMKVEILDKDKNVVRDLSANEYITKNTIVGKDEIKPKEISTAKWDGMLYDKFNGNLVKAPEGQYYYRFTMKIDYENAKPQVVEVPVKVDVTAPTLKVENYKILEEGKARVYFSAKDNLAGANFKLGIDVFVNKVRDKVAEESPVGYDEATKLYYIDVNGLKKDSYNTVELGVADNAMNLGGTNVRIKCGEVGKTELKLDLANGGIFTSNNKYTISGKLSNYVKTLVIGGKEITDFKFDDKGEITFKQEIESTSLKEGTNYIAVNAIDLDGSVVANYSFKVYRDTIVPELRFTSGNINVDTLTTIDGQATIEGIIADPGFGYSLYVNGTFYKDFDFDVIYRDKEKSQSKFKVTLNNLKSGDIVTLKVKDYNDNEKEIKLRVK